LSNNVWQKWRKYRSKYIHCKKEYKHFRKHHCFNAKWCKRIKTISSKKLEEIDSSIKIYHYHSYTHKPIKKISNHNPSN